MRKFLFPVGFALLLAGCSSMKPQGIASLPPDPESQNFATYLSARFAAQQHDMPQAARYYAQNLKTDPDNADVKALAFFYATTSGDFEAAANFAQKVVASAPDDRSARMALAVIAFKHKDYAEVRKQLAASAKGPLTVFVVSLFDAWASAAEGDAAQVAADMKTLTSLSGTEPVAAFHAALIADFMNQDADAAYAKALTLNPGSPRVVEAFGRYLERKNRPADATKFYRGVAASSALAPLADAGLARIAKSQKAEPMVTSAEQGAAEGLLNIASTITDRSDADVSILYLRMVLYLRPDMGLAQILLADRYEKLNKLDDAVAIYNKVDKASPYYRMAAIQAARDEQQLNRDDIAITQLKALTQAYPKDSD
ncbi:MAG TPA: tetratricopeptide repeat protein, partial [Rhizomicrobium sp.]|nr:tetratricopeptide repeat protein [Rhizomicrobium sp.]